MINVLWSSSNVQYKKESVSEKKSCHRFFDFSSSPPLKAERILLKKKKGFVVVVVVIAVFKEVNGTHARREKTIILYRP